MKQIKEKAPGLTHVSPGALQRSIQEKPAGEAGPQNGGQSLEDQQGARQDAQGQGARYRVQEGKEPAKRQQDAQRGEPAPAPDAQAPQVKGVDELGDAGEQQPHAEDEGERQGGKGLVEQNEQGQEYGQDAVHQEPDGAHHPVPPPGRR